jgi:hypothetical protein
MGRLYMRYQESLRSRRPEKEKRTRGRLYMGCCKASGNPAQAPQGNSLKYAVRMENPPLHLSLAGRRHSTPTHVRPLCWSLRGSSFSPSWAGAPSVGLRSVQVLYIPRAPVSVPWCEPDTNDHQFLTFHAPTIVLECWLGFYIIVSSSKSVQIVVVKKNSSTQRSD